MSWHRQRCLGYDHVNNQFTHMESRNTYFQSLNKSEVSRWFFHSLSILLLASFTWKATTDGTFQEELNVRASSVLTDRTKKSLNRCHWLCPGASCSACATGTEVSLGQSRRYLIGLTVDHGHQVWFLRLATFNADSHTNK
jgi:hypothetical protein